MNTAHKTENEKEEYFDPPEILEQKVNTLVEMIQNSSYFVAFTGAGISTSTGIPDFRSGINTVLPTGPGAWEKQAQNVADSDKYIKVSNLQAIPSPTHMALLQLQRQNILKFLISQNTDGLHRRSGFSPLHLAELHGNTNLEKCKNCSRTYLRDYRVRNAVQDHDHTTGRQCENPNCKQKLYDSIIKFGESLPSKDLNDGFEHSQKADLHLVLGSSLRVTPANKMPAQTAQLGKKLVIVNLQKTPLDSVAALRINAMCDDVMKMVMQKLELDIPEFILERRVVVEKSDQNTVTVSSEDVDECPYDIFKQVTLEQGESNPPNTLQERPYTFTPNSNQLTFTLGFYGHYGENDFKLDIDLDTLPLQKKVKYLLQYSPKLQDWISCEQL